MKSRGFTILEVMLSLAILIALLTVMSTVVGGVAMSRQRTSERTARDQGVTAAFELLAAALDTCVANDGRGGGGVRGDLLELQLVASRVPARRLEGNSSTGSPLADRDAIEFMLDGRDLVLRDVGESRQSVLVEDVVAIRFRYHDGDAWLEQWNSSVSGLPRAVELAVWTGAWPEGDVPAWMPEEEWEEDSMFEEEMLEDLLAAEPEDLFEEADPFGNIAIMADDPLLPEPDRKCVIAVFNPVSPDGESEFEESQLP